MGALAENNVFNETTDHNNSTGNNALITTEVLWKQCSGHNRKTLH